MIFSLLLLNRKSGWILLYEYKLDKDELLEAYKVFLLDWIEDGDNQYYKLNLIKEWNYL